MQSGLISNTQYYYQVYAWNSLRGSLSGDVHDGTDAEHRALTTSCPRRLGHQHHVDQADLGG